MALTNNTGADGRTQDLPAPCMRASFRPQSLILDDTEVFYLDTNGAYTDSIPRILMVTTLDVDAGADAIADAQTAFVHIFQEHVTVQTALHLDATAALLETGTDQTATNAGDFTIGYDSSTENYFIRNDTGANALISVTRIDGFTQDLVAETA